MLVEVQALVAPTTLPHPRRSFRGVEPPRVHQLLAVLDRHTDLGVAGLEVYVNVVGGMRVVEPAADLAIALAVVSSAVSKPLGPLAAWGEVGLTGELRGVPMSKRRLEEAQRLGINRAVATNGEASPGLLIDALSAAGLIPS